MSTTSTGCFPFLLFVSRGLNEKQWNCFCLADPKFWRKNSKNSHDFCWDFEWRIQMTRRIISMSEIVVNEMIKFFECSGKRAHSSRHLVGLWQTLVIFCGQNSSTDKRCFRLKVCLRKMVIRTSFGKSPWVDSCTLLCNLISAKLTREYSTRCRTKDGKSCLYSTNRGSKTKKKKIGCHQCEVSSSWPYKPDHLHFWIFFQMAFSRSVCVKFVVEAWKGRLNLQTVSFSPSLSREHKCFICRQRFFHLSLKCRYCEAHTCIHVGSAWVDTFLFLPLSQWRSSCVTAVTALQLSSSAAEAATSSSWANTIALLLSLWRIPD